MLIKNSTETINVIEIEPIIPSNAVCHVKYLKVGLLTKKFKPNLKRLNRQYKMSKINLKLGALARSSARQARFTLKYANK